LAWFGWLVDLTDLIFPFLYLFLSFELSSHCRNNALLVPILKKKKTYVQKEKAEKTN